MKSNAKIVVKFRTFEEVKAVQEVARYLKLTDKQFCHRAIMAGIHQVVEAYNKQRAQESGDGKEVAAVQLDTAPAAIQPSQGSDSGAHADSQTSDGVSGTQES